MDSIISSRYIDVGKVNIHYLIAGSGETIFLLHGWPTSSYLWRNIVADLAKDYQVIAIDLPGFGKSSKREGDSYSFRYYNRIISGFIEKLNIKNFTLGVHDLGGPIGLYWLIKNMEKVDRLILFNTLVYPEFSLMVKIFYLSTVLPGIRHWLSSPRGIKWAMRFGVFQKNKLTAEIINAYQQPFKKSESRKALLKSIQRLSIKGYEEIRDNLSNYNNPVQILYGENDKILPKVGDTMQRVKVDLPQASITSFSGCGHFLQEEIPKELAQNIREFMNINSN